MNRTSTETTVKSPVTMQKSRDYTGSADSGFFWFLTCRYCPWSARVGDKMTAQDEKRTHARTCYHYLKRLGLR